MTRVDGRNASLAREACDDKRYALAGGGIMTMGERWATIRGRGTALRLPREPKSHFGFEQVVEVARTRILPLEF